MTDFCILTSGIKTAITQYAQGASAGVGIVMEDDQNIAAEIDKAQYSLGMMILIGIPDFKNDAPLSKHINAKIEIQILIREVPTMWRVQSNNNPIRCPDLAQAVATAVQNVFIPGFQPLRVMNGRKGGNILTKGPANDPIIFQDYVLDVETMQIFNF